MAKIEQPEAPSKVFIVSSSPHLMDGGTSRRVMMEVVIGTLPAVAVAIYLFQLMAVGVILSCVLTALATEAVFNWCRRKPQSIGDGSALISGLILGLSLPPEMKLWACVLGTVVAVGVGKMVFGGLGANIFNPAMVGRAFLMACFGTMMTTWCAPVVLNGHAKSDGVPTAVCSTVEGQSSTGDGEAGCQPAGGKLCQRTGQPCQCAGQGEQCRCAGGGGADVNAVTGATPLALAKQPIKDAAKEDKKDKASPEAANRALLDIFLGKVSGSAGETSALAWLIGGLFLLFRRTITWHIPVAVLATAGLIATGAWLANPDVYVNPLVHLSAGGLMMCAFFIATDPVTCPLSRLGRILFGIGVGGLVMLIRLKGGYPEGVMYAILLMNAMTPLLDRWTRPTPMGGHVKA